ncbi:hypothetical protein [Halomonas caseinilytica]|uniref:hypothetical protein n=1 Tax=Halomonas caseinilytica TaxID=438744 RepID=UPI0007E5B55E|nr:hypothetical protein [Halomonas caseinilytica]SEM67287.1 hypothetical protein SAMN04487952_1063 [Halomonas caseinilytica]
MKKWAALPAMLVMTGLASADVDVGDVTYDPGSGVIGIYSFELHNNYDVAVSKVDLYMVATTPGREVPWADSRYSYEIPGGLEPGEARQLRAVTPPDLVHAEGQEVVINVDVEASYDASGDIIEQ